MSKGKKKVRISQDDISNAMAHRIKADTSLRAVAPAELNLKDKSLYHKACKQYRQGDYIKATETAQKIKKTKK